MTETTTFPRRDADGRVIRLTDLLGWVAAGLVLGTIVLLIVDGIVSLVSGSRFGQLSGWLAGILPFWFFVEEYRAWRSVPARTGLALVGALLAVVIGVAATALAGAVLPPLGSGAVGVAISALGYGALWYAGIRWLADRSVHR
jgi:hypothetical protein